MNKTSWNHDGLSQRQLYVLGRLGDGSTNKEIALDLKVSVKTVEHHREKIVKMLKIRNFAHMVKTAVAFGLTNLMFMVAAAAQPSTKTVIIFWDKPANVDSNTVYNIYWTQNIALATNQWPLFATVRTPTNYSATQYGFITNLPPASYYFTATASNTFWKLESFFSSAAYTPPVATNLLINLGLTLP